MGETNLMIPQESNHHVRRKSPMPDPNQLITQESNHHGRRKSNMGETDLLIPQESNHHGRRKSPMPDPNQLITQESNHQGRRKSGMGESGLLIPQELKDHGRRKSPMPGTNLLIPQELNHQGRRKSRSNMGDTNLPIPQELNHQGRRKSPMPETNRPISPYPMPDYSIRSPPTGDTHSKSGLRDSYKITIMDPSELKKIQEHQDKLKTSQFKDKEFRTESQSKQDFNLAPRKNSHIDQFYEPIPVYCGGNAPIDTKKNTFNPIANLGNLKPKLQIPES